MDFTFDKNTGCAPLGVKFTDNTNSQAGALTDWLWVFGDGGTSTSANPSYTYAHPGNVAVSLKVKNVHGCERTKIITSAINVLGPTVSFSPSATTSCDLPVTINFTDQSTGQDPLTHSWDFKDGSTSAEINPSHEFTKLGSYNVTQTVRDANGCEASNSVLVSAGSEGGMNFTPSASKICVGQELTFLVQSNSTVTSYEWNFGNQTSSTDEKPAASYDTPGTYAITLKAKLKNNTCFSIVTKTVEVVAGPQTAFTFSIDCNYSATFNNTSVGSEKVEWYIGNTLYSTKPSYTHPFGFPGEYTVRLITYNGTKCSNELEKTIIVPASIVASFLPNVAQDCFNPSLSGCAPFSLQFTDDSSSPSEYASLWEFGDGATSTEKNPLHVFSKGNFTVKLTITNAQGCSSFITAKVAVIHPKPISKFTLDKTSACAGEEVTFTSQSENTNFWCWDFGDGTTGNEAKVIHKYLHPGVYTVKLVSKNAGCSDTFTMVDAIEIKNPYVNFGISKNCATPYTIGLTNFSEKLQFTSMEFW